MIRVIPPGGGEVVGDTPDRRVEILSDDDSLHATWSFFGPYRDGADLHIHHHHTDLFYVLEGVLTARLGPDGAPHDAPAGTLVCVPPLVVHGFRNTTDAELRYLNFHAPGQGFADFMRGLADFDQHDPPADGGRSVDDVVIATGPGVLVDVEHIAVRELDAPQGVEPGALASLYVVEGEIEVDGASVGAGAWAQVPGGSGAAVRGAARYLEIRTNVGSPAV